MNFNKKIVGAALTILFVAIVNLMNISSQEHILSDISLSALTANAQFFSEDGEYGDAPTGTTCSSYYCEDDGCYYETTCVTVF